MSKTENATLAIKATSTCLLFALAFVGFCTAVFLNGYVYASRVWLPERAVYTRPLFFDYNSTEASALANFVQWHQTANGNSISPDAVQFLRVGQHADVDIELTVPDRKENHPLFMLRCELLSDSGAVLQRGHRALMIQQRSTIVQTARHLALLPLFLLKIVRESEVLRVRSLLRHRERRGAPLAAVRVRLAAHLDHLPPPLVQAGMVRIDINRSWWQSILALFRLNSVLHAMLLLFATALMLLSMAVMAATCFFGVRMLFVYGLAPEGAEEAARAVKRDVGNALETATAAVAQAPAAIAQATRGDTTESAASADLRHEVRKAVRTYSQSSGLHTAASNASSHGASPPNSTARNGADAARQQRGSQDVADSSAASDSRAGTSSSARQRHRHSGT